MAFKKVLGVWGGVFLLIIPTNLFICYFPDPDFASVQPYIPRRNRPAISTEKTEI
jgi:hypothetical protein